MMKCIDLNFSDEDDYVPKIEFEEAYRSLHKAFSVSKKL